MCKLALICLFAVVAAVSAQLVVPQVCPAGEIYKECGTACPARCPEVNANTGEPEVPPAGCMTLCVRGCFCADGLVRDLKRSNACVERTKCTI